MYSVQQWGNATAAVRGVTIAVHRLVMPRAVALGLLATPSGQQTHAAPLLACLSRPPGDRPPQETGPPANQQKSTIVVTHLCLSELVNQ